MWESIYEQNPYFNLHLKLKDKICWQIWDRCKNKSTSFNAKSSSTVRLIYVKYSCMNKSNNLSPCLLSCLKIIKRVICEAFNRTLVVHKCRLRDRMLKLTMGIQRWESAVVEKDSESNAWANIILRFCSQIVWIYLLFHIIFFWFLRLSCLNILVILWIKVVSNFQRKTWNIL